MYLQFSGQLVHGHLEQEKSGLEGGFTDWQSDVTFVAEQVLNRVSHGSVCQTVSLHQAGSGFSASSFEVHIIGLLKRSGFSAYSCNSVPAVWKIGLVGILGSGVDLFIS